MMESKRLEQQMQFLLELDHMKNIYRQTRVLHEDRAENDAEHSFHLAIMTVVLAEHANAPIDVCKTMKMVLAHDIVEIDAGDTYCYDAIGYQDKAARETRAADRIFALLPPDQGAELRALWEEFEAGDTPEARFANAVDRVQPLTLNYQKGGQSWRAHGVQPDQVRGRMGAVRAGSETLADYVEALIDDADRRGFFVKEP